MSKRKRLVTVAVIVVVVTAGTFFNQNRVFGLSRLVLLRMPVFIAPQISATNSDVVLQGVSEDRWRDDPYQREGYLAQKSFEVGHWISADSTESVSVGNNLTKAPALRIGEKNTKGPRGIVGVIPSENPDLVLVQVGVDEFTQSDDYEEPYGVPFTVVEDYRCVVSTLSCSRTDIIDRAVQHMAKYDITTQRATVFEFWSHWNSKTNSLIGFAQGEGASDNGVTRYDAVANTHAKTDTTNFDDYDISPSASKAIIFLKNNTIALYEIGKELKLLQTYDYSHLEDFYKPAYPSGGWQKALSPLDEAKVQWSADDENIYFVQDYRIHSLNVKTGVFTRLLDASSLRNLPSVHSKSFSQQYSWSHLKLTPNGRYAYYMVQPTEDSNRINVVIDLLNHNDYREFESAPYGSE